MSENDSLLTMEQAIDRLSTTRSTFYRWLRSGRIKGHKVGRQWRFTEMEVSRFLHGEEPSIEFPNSDELIRTLFAASGHTDDVPDGPSNPVRVVNAMLLCCIRMGASHLFLDIDNNTGPRVSLRIDGQVREIARYDTRAHKPLIERIKQMCQMDVNETQIPQDGRFRMNIDSETDRWLDFIVSMFPANYGESCTLSIRDPAAAHVGFDGLGLVNRNLVRVETSLDRNSGLYLIGGPAGSGKTVSAYSILNVLNLPERRVLSIEDPGAGMPVEDVVQGVINLQKMNDKAAYVRAAVRQSYDVLHVGYTASSETLSELLEGGLTKHVITTMHFHDAISGLMLVANWVDLDRLTGDGIALIAAQRLVRRLCTDCREPVTLSEQDQELIRTESKVNEAEPFNDGFHQAVGCNNCHGGYKGRIGIFETLVPDQTLYDAMMQGGGYNELRAAAISGGMETLLMDGLMKAGQGLISLQEVRRVCADLLPETEAG